MEKANIIKEAICPNCNLPMDDVEISHKTKKPAKILFRGYHCEKCDQCFSPAYVKAFWEGYRKAQTTSYISGGFLHMLEFGDFRISESNDKTQIVIFHTKSGGGYFKKSDFAKAVKAFYSKHF